MRDETPHKKRLKHVVSERQRRYGIPDRSNDHHENPQIQERGKLSETVQHVGEVASRLGECGAKLCVAHGAHHGEYPCAAPYYEGHPNRAGFFQDAFWGHEYSSANYGANYESHAVEKTHASLDGNAGGWTAMVDLGGGGQQQALFRYGGRFQQHFLE